MENISKKIINQSTSEAIIERILMICERKGITLHKLAKISEVSPSTLRRIVCGKTNASLETIEKLCKGLNYTFADFFSTKALRRLPSYPAKKIIK